MSEAMSGLNCPADIISKSTDISLENTANNMGKTLDCLKSSWQKTAWSLSKKKGWVWPRWECSLDLFPACILPVWHLWMPRRGGAMCPRLRGTAGCLHSEQQRGIARDFACLCWEKGRPHFFSAMAPILRLVLWISETGWCFPSRPIGWGPLEYCCFFSHTLFFL